MTRQSCTTVGLLVPLFTLLTSAIAPASAQTRFPDETEPHEGTWLVWPHHYTYGTAYRNSLDATWVAMTKALAPGENVHIVAYNTTEQTRIINLLTTAAVPLTRVDFVVRQSDDVWVRDNGPMFVFDSAGSMMATDWGFDGWGDDTPFTKDETIPVGVCSALNVPRVDIGGIVLEGGALEYDGHGAMMACRSSILESKRNPGVTQSQLEAALLTHFGFTKFIWLDGAFGGTDDITDMHIDGFMRFAPGRSVTMTFSGTSSDDSAARWRRALSNFDAGWAAPRPARPKIASAIVMRPVTTCFTVERCCGCRGDMMAPGVEGMTPLLIATCGPDRRTVVLDTPQPVDDTHVA